MTLTTNYHLHTPYCDGGSTSREYADIALTKGFTSIGFSSHAPLPFESDWNMKSGQLPAYINEIQELKRDYRGRLEIYCGLEIDYIPGIINPRSDHLAGGLDYTIGAVHYLGRDAKGRYWTVDGPLDELLGGISHSFHGDNRLAVEAYYDNMTCMIEEFPPDIIGHLDLIKRHNGEERLFAEDDEWYRSCVMRTLMAIAASPCIMEINTGGIGRKKIDSLYPSAWIIEEAYRKNIPVTINSDAHAASQLDAYYREAALEVKKAGYRHYMALRGGKWIRESIP